MFAVVESGSITSMPKGNKGITIGDNQYPATIFTLWTEAERNAIGIYTVEIDETNLKDVKWYTNTTINYAYDSSANKVKGTYGTATARPYDDVKWTQSQIDAGLAPSGADTNTVASKGLKTICIEEVKTQAQTQQQQQQQRQQRQQQQQRNFGRSAIRRSPSGDHKARAPRIK